MGGQGVGTPSVTSKGDRQEILLRQKGAEREEGFYALFLQGGRFSSAQS